MWKNGSLLPYPQLLSFLLLFHHGKTPNLRAVFVTYLPTPWEHGLLSAARIPAALPGDCASQSCLHLSSTVTRLISLYESDFVGLPQLQSDQVPRAFEGPKPALR